MITLSVIKNGETSYGTVTPRDMIFDPKDMYYPKAYDLTTSVFKYHGRNVRVKHTLDQIQTLIPTAFLRLSVKKKGAYIYTTPIAMLFVPERLDLPRALSTDTIFHYNLTDSEPSRVKKTISEAIKVDETFAVVQQMLIDIGLTNP